MATLKRLTPGQVLWSISRRKLGNTTLSVGSLDKCVVISVHEDHAMISWNGNPARRYSERHIKKLRVNKPEPKGKILGYDNYR